MYKLIFNSILMCTIIILCGCFNDNGGMKLDSKKIFPESFKFYVYNNGKEKYVGVVGKGSDIYQKLLSWFLDNRGGWERDINSYAPNIFFQSDRMTINILKDGIIVNYSEDGKKWIQVSKSHTDKILKEIGE